MRNGLMIYMLMGSVFASSCVTMKKSVLTGIGAGMVTGIVASTMMSKRKGTGALVGAAIGGAGGYLIHDALEKRDAKTRKQTLLNLDKFSVSAPTGKQGVQDFRLSAPDVDKECFDWEVRGNKLVQKHCVWTIRGNSFWMPSTRKRK